MPNGADCSGASRQGIGQLRSPFWTSFSNAPGRLVQTCSLRNLERWNQGRITKDLFWLGPDFSEGGVLKSAQLLTLAGRSSRLSYCLQLGGGFRSLA